MFKQAGAAMLILLAIMLSSCSDSSAKPQAEVSPKMTSSTPAPKGDGKTETITLGAGCFWCVEAVFTELRGVKSVVSGYTGGKVDNPTYQQVCSGTTGHAEVIQVTFDPSVLSLHDLLQVFFTTHDPTTLNRQGADAGTQYRSAIFVNDDTQKRVAEQVKKEMQSEWSSPIVTEITPASRFYAAEDYHQDYYALNGTQPYCRMVIDPKMEKFRHKYQDRLKNTAPH